MKKIIAAFLICSLFVPACAGKKVSTLDTKVEQQEKDIGEIRDSLKRINELLWDLKTQGANNGNNNNKNDDAARKQYDAMRQESDRLKAELNEKEKEMQEERQKAMQKDLSDQISALDKKIDGIAAQPPPAPVAPAPPSQKPVCKIVRVMMPPPEDLPSKRAEAIQEKKQATPNPTYATVKKNQRKPAPKKKAPEIVRPKNVGTGC